MVKKLISRKEFYSTLRDLEKGIFDLREMGKSFFTPTTIKQDLFILEYNDFGKELIQKSNELFQGTEAEIPLQDSGEVPNMHILKRLALITTIYNDTQLKSANLWPITPLQSELLLKANKLPSPEKYWEDLALILYDTKGENPKESKALYQSLQKHRADLGLNKSDLEEKLLIINAGLEVDKSMPHGVKPIILPGATQVYIHPVLEKTGNYKFEYGLEQGLPSVGELGKGNRTLYMPDETKDIGLRVLYRYWDLDLGARGRFLAGSLSDGRVSFALQGAAKK